MNDYRNSAFMTGPPFLLRGQAATRVAPDPPDAQPRDMRLLAARAKLDQAHRTLVNIMFHAKKATETLQENSSKEADPRLLMAFDLTKQYRKIQLGTLRALKDRSLAILEIIFLGTSIILAFGASSHGDLRPWMIILLLIGLGYSMASTALIMKSSKNWNGVSDWDVLIEAKGAKCACAECDHRGKTIDECIEQLLAEGKEGISENSKIVKWKHAVLESEFGVLAILVILAVIFWVTLGS